MKLHFPDPSCKPIELGKELILFDDLPRKEKRPIVAEDYNELVFVEPTAYMLKLLTQDKQAEMKSAQQMHSEAQSAADVEMRDANDQSMSEQEAEAGDAVNQFVAEKRNKDNLFKPIDMQSLEKGFKEKDFEVKEKQDLETLRLAVDFIKHQIEAKRIQLRELEL